MHVHAVLPDPALRIERMSRGAVGAYSMAVAVAVAWRGITLSRGMEA